MSTELNKIIAREEDVFKRSNNPNERVNILFNLITIKYNIIDDDDNKLNIYVDIKSLINDYVNLIKVNDFGYDLFCREKVLKVIGYLSLNEQRSILNYLYSTLSREFPEIEKHWVQDAIKKVRIQKILQERQIWNLPNAFLLYSALSIPRLLLALTSLIIVVGIVLLPSPFEWMEIFEIKYVQYADNFYLNHALNTISLFGALKNGCEVVAINAFGLLIQISAKILFIILIVNYIYKRIADKISIR